MKIEFYYSSKVGSTLPYFCDNVNAIDLCRKLKEKGVDVRTFDVEDHPPGFMKYNDAVVGPAAKHRAVFGTKGALEEEFGRSVPALLVFDKETDRYPREVFPRHDKDRGRLVGVEEALKIGGAE